MVTFNQQDFLSLRDVTEKLPGRAHINSVRRWVLKGARGRRLPAKMVGGKWFVHRDDLAAFLESSPNDQAGRPRKLTVAQQQADELAREVF